MINITLPFGKLRQNVLKIKIAKEIINNVIKKIQLYLCIISILFIISLPYVTGARFRKSMKKL